VGTVRFAIGCAAAGAGAAAVFLVGQWCGARNPEVERITPQPVAIARAPVERARPQAEMTLADAVERGRRLLAAPRRPSTPPEARRAAARSALDSPVADRRRRALLELSLLDRPAAVDAARHRLDDPALLEPAAGLLLRPPAGAAPAPEDAAAVEAALRRSTALGAPARTAVESLLFQALASLRSPAAASHAATLLRSPDVRTRYLTTVALLELPANAAEPLLRHSLNDPDPTIRRRAKDSLTWLAQQLQKPKHH